MIKPVQLFYSLYENYPAFRVDLSELFATSLKKQGLETVWYMASKEAREKFGVVDYLGEKCYLPVKLVEKNFLNKLTNKLFYWWYDLRCLLSPEIKAFEILQVRDKYIASIAAMIAAKIHKKKFVYWCSYPFPEHYLELAKLDKGYKRIYYWLHGFFAKFLLYQFIIPLSDYCFVQTEKMRDDIAEYGVAKSKMTAVPMGVPARLLDWADSAKVEIVANQIVYIGIMTPERHLEMLIEAFSLVKQNCPDATLLMVGNGVHPHERKALEDQVAQLGLSDSVTFTGFVPLEQAWAYAAKGAVCVSPIFPSPILNCGSPTKLYEYMALGRPVVCNVHPEQIQVIAETGIGLCVEWDSGKFAEAICWILNNNEKAEQNAKNGPLWIRQHRTYDILAEVVWTKYQQLLAY